jgi:hypothetical protein
MLSPRSIFPSLLKVAIVAAIGATALVAAVPRGWHLSGSKPHDYETGVADAQHDGHRVAYVQAVVPTADGFGTLMQSVLANRYVGTRVRLRASVKADDVGHWAGLWMRVDKAEGDNSRTLAIDNMHEEHDRSLKGTTDWEDCQVVLDIPADATHIAFGVVLVGLGKVSISNVSFEIVGQDVSTTVAKPVIYLRNQDKMRDFRRPIEAPLNLDFQP